MTDQELKRLQRVLYTTSDFLDFFSVVDGFRDVALIRIPSHPIEVIKGPPSITVRTLPLREQQKIIREYLRTHRKDYVYRQIGGRHFIMHKRQMSKVSRFMTIKKSEAQFHRELGLLLSYPECCIRKFLSSDPRRKRAGFSSIPFVPCDRRKHKSWKVIYSKLMMKYDIPETDFNINV